MGAGYVYVLTNPSFPEYVKIGYADDVEARLRQLNQSECLPYAFRVYCTYGVTKRLADTELHALIDGINPDLRTVETFDGKPRVREFYRMSPEDAWGILARIAAFTGTADRLKLCAPGAGQLADEEAALFADAPQNVAAAWTALKERTLALDGVALSFSRNHAFFSAGGRRFLACEPQKKSLKLYLAVPAGRLEAPKGAAVLMKCSSPCGVGDYKSFAADAAAAEALMPLVRQAFGAAPAEGQKTCSMPDNEGEQAFLDATGENESFIQDVAGHFKAVPAAEALFRLLHARILSMGSVSFGRGSRYAWYKTGGGEFLSLTFNRGSLRLNLMARLDELDDPLGLACRNDGHLGRSECKVFAGSPEELDGAMDLIRQCFEHAHAEPGRRRRGGFRRRFWTAFCAHAAGKPEMKVAFGFRTPRDDSWYDLSSEADCPGIELAILARSGFVRAALYFKGNGDLCEDFRRQEDAVAALASGEFAWSGTGGEFRLYAERGVDPEDESSWSAAFDWLCAMSLRLKALALKCNEKD